MSIILWYYHRTYGAEIYDPKSYTYPLRQSEKYEEKERGNIMSCSHC